MDEKECDPISWSLFKLILEWALKSENVMIWVFSLLQWHCMARSVNIGILGLHNFKRLEDSIVCRYDMNKKDPTGEKVNDKHIYDNPFEGILSIYCAIGVWCSLQQGRLSASEELFQLLQSIAPSFPISWICTRTLWKVSCASLMLVHTASAKAVPQELHQEPLALPLCHRLPTAGNGV